MPTRHDHLRSWVQALIQLAEKVEHFRRYVFVERAVVDPAERVSDIAPGGGSVAFASWASGRLSIFGIGQSLTPCGPAPPRTMILSEKHKRSRPR